MPYTYDTEPAPLWVDSERGEIVTDPASYAPTAPGRLTASELDASIASKQRQRDCIAAASQAHRIPRIHRLAGADMAACTGDCNQGKRPCSGHGECLASRLDPVEEAGHQLVWLLCLSVLLVMVPALLFGVEWSDVVGLLAAIGGVR